MFKSAYDYPKYRVRLDNMRKLFTVSRVAMNYRVMLCADGWKLKSLSIRPEYSEEKVGEFWSGYQQLGVFRAEPGETRAELYRRLYDEAVASGVVLGPPEM